MEEVNSHVDGSPSPAMTCEHIGTHITRREDVSGLANFSELTDDQSEVLQDPRPAIGQADEMLGRPFAAEMGMGRNLFSLQLWS